jgi:hypothetical protein
MTFQLVRLMPQNKFFHPWKLRYAIAPDQIMLTWRWHKLYITTPMAAPIYRWFDRRFHG